MAGRRFDEQTPGAASRGADGVEARLMWVGDQKLMVAIKRAASTRPALLLFNGIGANWELAEPFLNALTDTTAIIFDCRVSAARRYRHCLIVPPASPA